MRNIRFEFIVVIATLLLVGFSNNVRSESKIVWQNLDEYRDLKPGNETKKHFRKRVFKSLSAYLNKLTKDLPEGHKLTLTVTDLDLAGNVLPGNSGVIGGQIDRLRVLRRVDFPYIEFNYSLVDSNGKVLESKDNIKLKDIMYLDRNTGAVRRNESLKYEKRLLKEWYIDRENIKFATKD